MSFGRPLKLSFGPGRVLGLWWGAVSGWTPPGGVRHPHGPRYSGGRMKVISAWIDDFRGATREAPPLGQEADPAYGCSPQAALSAAAAVWGDRARWPCTAILFPPHVPLGGLGWRVASFWCGVASLLHKGQPHVTRT
jgi:hypothetical protein